MTDENLFKTLALISPFVASGITYFLTIRTKKSEYLYQNRLPAFKEVANELVKIKKYCTGKIAMQDGNEFSPYWDEPGSALSLRLELANANQLNAIFLTVKSKSIISAVDSQLGLLCNMELSLHGHSPEERINYIGNAYEGMLETVVEALRELYKEIGLPSN